ncbi:hypothetical protein A9168_01685 [Macellibacteroides sp. HH-ZS]|jgi:hypothetical protein|nr:hypothetical protein A9168_01685 [Macellibacteroides sp. HH-ZS]
METKLYMHIAPLNLAHYFSCACLKPVRYISNRNNDFQDQFEDYLVFSTKRRTIGVDCSLEIVLAKDELKEIIKIKNDIYLYAKPLPVTRVKRIYFTSADLMDKTITIVEMKSAFIPRQLATRFPDDEEPKADCLKIKCLKKGKPDFSAEIKKYESLLGGFALMNTVAIPPMNYSGNYFSTLSRFNLLFHDSLSTLNRKIDERFHDAFEGKKTFTSLYPYLNKRITKEDLEEVAKQEQQEIRENKISGLIDVNNLQQASYIVAILYNYGLPDEGRRNNINTLITTRFQQDIRQERAEVVALCYGLNRGYGAFSNKYQSVTLKFRLDSRVDYYTIESLYQYAFNKILQSSNFPYLDSWIPQFSQTNYTSLQGYHILDKIVIDTPPLVENIFQTDVKNQKKDWWLKSKESFLAQNDENLDKLRWEIESNIRREQQTEIAKKEQMIKELEKALQKQQIITQDLEKKASVLLKQESDIQILNEKPANYGTAHNTAKEENDYKEAFNDACKLIEKIEKSTTGKTIRTLIDKFREKHNMNSSDKDLFT